MPESLWGYSQLSYMFEYADTIHIRDTVTYTLDSFPYQSEVLKDGKMYICYSKDSDHSHPITFENLINDSVGRWVVMGAAALIIIIVAGVFIVVIVVKRKKKAKTDESSAWRVNNTIPGQQRKKLQTWYFT